MVCSCCHKSDHNIRRCPKFHQDEIAKAYLAGQAKHVAFEFVDMALPGAGVVCGVVDKLYSCAKAVHILHSSNTVNEKRRAVIEILGEYAGE